MAAALRSLGTSIEDTEDGWAVEPGDLVGGGTVDCGLAGTVMRFVPPVAALARGDVRFDGDPHARKRPMAGVLDGLRGLGVDITDEGHPGLPFTVHGEGRVRGGEVTLDASASSQFVSGLMLAGPRFEAQTVIRHVGPPVPSLPHIEMTVAMLAEAGANVVADVEDPSAASWTITPGPLRGRDFTIEPDLSNAGPFLAAAAATGGTVRIPDWPSSTTQAGDALRTLLTAMGAEVSLHSDSGSDSDSPDLKSGGLTVTGPADGLVGIDVDLRDVGELTPVLAALCALAKTPSRLRGIAHLRGHETDRLAALARELGKVGSDVTEESDGLSIRPGSLHGAQFETYDDHRMATAAAVLGLVVPDMIVENVATTAKTLPDFVSMWQGMLA